MARPVVLLPKWRCDHRETVLALSCVVVCRLILFLWLSWLHVTIIITQTGAITLVATRGELIIIVESTGK